MRPTEGLRCASEQTQQARQISDAMLDVDDNSLDIGVAKNYQTLASTWQAGDVLGQRVFTQLGSYARLFKSAERHSRMEVVDAVHLAKI